MNIIISNVGDKPIYDQIYTQIKAAITKGELKEGDALPSIRALARDLKISVITTKRAFDDLERDGFILSVQGKGSFVAPFNVELVKEERRKELEEHLSAVRTIADELKMSDEEVFELYHLLKEV
ncbi:MAG: GntR family transcriptional regulator [Bacillota bacterium]|nr:MAG: GntR family transcriptional regulator [Bacillota bacterium]